MIRTVLAVATVATVTLGLTAVVAQQDPIAARKALMKGNGDQARIGGQMSRGEAPFDAAKAQLIFTTYADTADKVGALFPDNSKTGGDTAADPKIWQNKADFDAKVPPVTKAIADAKFTDAASLKVAYDAIQEKCTGCHDTYRVKLK
jgi:cytochrome c556